jgi:acyl CoA:acetate/3-ketoacid CoA transferase alpha subunit
MNKIFKTVKEAIVDINDGAVIDIGGFFTAGVPRTLSE